MSFGNKTLPVEALVLPHLGPDNRLLDNSIMHAFGTKLDWATQKLSCKSIDVNERCCRESSGTRRQGRQRVASWQEAGAATTRRHGMSTRYVGCVGYVGMSDADAMLAMPAVGRTVRCPRHVDACV